MYCLFTPIPVMARRFILASLVRGSPPYQGACVGHTWHSARPRRAPDTPEDRQGLTTTPFHIWQGFPLTVAPAIGEGVSFPATGKSGESTRLPVYPLVGSSRARAAWLPPDPSHCRRERARKGTHGRLLSGSPPRIDVHRGEVHWPPASLPPEVPDGGGSPRPPSRGRRSSQVWGFVVLS